MCVKEASYERVSLEESMNYDVSRMREADKNKPIRLKNRRELSGYRVTFAIFR